MPSLTQNAGLQRRFLRPARRVVESGCELSVRANGLHKNPGRALLKPAIIFGLPRSSRKGGREVECARLEIWFTVIRNVGSNPTPSASSNFRLLLGSP